MINKNLRIRVKQSSGKIIREYPEVRVKWMDAASPGTMESYDVDEALALEPLIMYDRGVLLGENKSGNSIILASNSSGGELFRRIIILPHQFVLQIDLLGWMIIEKTGGLK